MSCLIVGWALASFARPDLDQATRRRTLRYWHQIRAVLKKRLTAWTKTHVRAGSDSVVVVLTLEFRFIVESGLSVRRPIGLFGAKPGHSRIIYSIGSLARGDDGVQKIRDAVTNIFPRHSHAQDHQSSRGDDRYHLAEVPFQHERVGREVGSFASGQPNLSATIDRAMSLVGRRHGRAHVIDEVPRQKLFAVPFSAQSQEFAEACPIVRFGVEKGFPKKCA
jgi:hypothetical protein